MTQLTTPSQETNASLPHFFIGVGISFALTAITVAIGCFVYTLAFEEINLLLVSLFPVIPFIVYGIVLMLVFVFLNWLLSRKYRDNVNIGKGLKIGYVFVILIPVIFWLALSTFMIS